MRKTNSCNILVKNIKKNIKKYNYKKTNNYNIKYKKHKKNNYTKDNICLEYRKSNITCY